MPGAHGKDSMFRSNLLFTDSRCMSLGFGLKSQTPRLRDSQSVHTGMAPHLTSLEQDAVSDLRKKGFTASQILVQVAAADAGPLA